MKITFVLPGLSRHPVGGYKVVYQYANYFAQKGNTVNIVHVEQKPNGHVSVHAHLKNLALATGIIGRKTITWFSFDKNINLYFCPNFSDSRIPNGDVIIATAWFTAQFVAKMSAEKGKKFYFIQHYEIQNGFEKEVDDSWHLPMTKIVIATWLQDIGNRLGVETYLVKNFVDHESFYPTQPIERPISISMLNHSAEWKGSKDGFQVLKKISEKYPNVKIRIFGVPDRPKFLPEQIEYFVDASVQELRDEIYSKSTIFLFPSHSEGWGLTATEAMACGNALVSTNNGGVLDFGINKDNAIIVPVGDITALTSAVEYLIENPDTMKNYQRRSIDIANMLTIQKSGEQFLHILKAD